jgi:hypothetical protein
MNLELVDVKTLLIFDATSSKLEGRKLLAQKDLRFTIKPVIAIKGKLSVSPKYIYWDWKLNSKYQLRFPCLIVAIRKRSWY